MYRIKMLNSVNCNYTYKETILLFNVLMFRNCLLKEEFFLESKKRRKTDQKKYNKNKVYLKSFLI